MVREGLNIISSQKIYLAENNLFDQVSIGNLDCTNKDDLLQGLIPITSSLTVSEGTNCDNYENMSRKLKHRTTNYQNCSEFNTI